MAIFFGIVVVILALVFGAASIMQSYASAQQAEAVIETAEAAQIATMANLVVIVVMALVLVLILTGIVWLIARLNSKPKHGHRSDRRQDGLEAGRRYGKQLQQHLAQIDAKASFRDESLLVIAADDEVEEYLSGLFKDLES